jgi:hypothetical protein
LLSLLQTPQTAKKFRVFRQHRPQTFAAAVNTAFHRTDVRTGHLRYLLVVVAVQVRKKDGLALFEREGEERRLDAFAERNAFDVVRGALRGVRYIELMLLFERLKVKRLGWPAATTA